MSQQTPITPQMRLKIEYHILKSILNNDFGADIHKVENDLSSVCSKKEVIFEGISLLMQSQIITFSQYYDFVFHPDVACSPLVAALKKLKTPPISVDEYTRFGWRKLAGLEPER